MRNVIRINETSIDVTGSNAIAFGYVNELARAGRVIAGRHRLRCVVSSPGAPSGSLWRADSLWFGSPVLVELLDPMIGEDAGLAELFMSEARAARAVVSPFVSRVLDFGIDGSTPYLVSEPCWEGGPRSAGTARRGELGAGAPVHVETLSTRISGGRGPNGSMLTRLFRELALAVDAMHARGVLHRDLRSERVLLSSGTSGAEEREVTKLSFGISKLMNDTLELVRTMARRSIGPAASPAYLSPEQILGTSPLTPQSDLWSLAVIAFECVTRQLPFAGATTGERLVNICTGATPRPSDLCAVPRAFDAWFERGVEKPASLRWSSAREMSDALDVVFAT